MTTIPSGPGLPSDDEFESLYAGTPPWDIGRPQRAFLDLADSGRLRGKVLDVGCGTGEQALLAASGALETTGIDLAPSAIKKAKHKAEERNLTVRFVVGNAMRLSDELGDTYDTLLDCGLFHVFSDEDRAVFVEGLTEATNPGGVYHLLCFSELQPGDWGPRRVTRDEIRRSFATGWEVDSIEPSVLEMTISPQGAKAWLASMTRKA